MKSPAMSWKMKKEKSGPEKSWNWALVVKKSWNEKCWYLITHQHNNRFTALCLDYPGEPNGERVWWTHFSQHHQCLQPSLSTDALFILPLTRSNQTRTHCDNNNNNNDRFTALCPGLPGWASTSKHSPTHQPDDHPVFIGFFHLQWSIASSLFKLCAWQSFCTTSLHVLFGLPLGLEPFTSYSIHFFTQSQWCWKIN